MSFAREALRLELRTDAGKINYRGLLFLFLVFAATQATDVMKEVEGFFSSSDTNEGSSTLVLLFVVFTAAFLCCAALMVLNDHTRGRRVDRDETGGPDDTQ